MNIIRTVLTSNMQINILYKTCKIVELDPTHRYSLHIVTNSLTILDTHYRRGCREITNIYVFQLPHNVPPCLKQLLTEYAYFFFIII